MTHPAGRLAHPTTHQPDVPLTKFSRRNLLRGGLITAVALTLYAGEIERHWIELKRISIAIPNLPEAFDGFRIAQLSDIHLDFFTEPFFLRRAVRQINDLKPDAVFLTGDFITEFMRSPTLPLHAAWLCAEILQTLTCARVYGILGNHDCLSNPTEIARALTAHGVQVLRNANLPIEQNGARLWLAGLDDPLAGRPDLNKTIPERIRSLRDEPVLLLCHEPDYIDTILRHPASQSIRFMLSGHTHGGQVRIPFYGPLTLPLMGKNYVEGLFQLGGMQLYVNRGLGTVGVPFRFDCPPEITEITLHRAMA